MLSSDNGSTQGLPSSLAEELKLDFDYQDVHDNSIDDSQSMKLAMSDGVELPFLLPIVIWGLVGGVDGVVGSHLGACFACVGSNPAPPKDI